MKMTQKDNAVEMLLRCCNGRENSRVRITDNLLVKNGICTEEELPMLLGELLSDGLIEHKRFDNERFVSIVPTPKCYTYFRNKAEKAKERRWQDIKYLITTAIAILALIIAIVK